MYLYFLFCDRPDDGHVWSKHVADLQTNCFPTSVEVKIECNYTSTPSISSFCCEEKFIYTFTLSNPIIYTSLRFIGAAGGPWSRDSSVTTVTKLQVEEKEIGVGFPSGVDTCLPSTTFILAQGHNFLALQLVPEAISPEIN